jgi:hypothetical protein
MNSMTHEMLVDISKASRKKFLGLLSAMQGAGRFKPVVGSAAFLDQPSRTKTIAP